MDGLGVGQIGMYPQPIARLKIRDLCDWQSLARALYVDLEFRACQIEGSVLGVRGREKSQEENTPIQSDAI
jgi:hypothetical protein